MNQGLFVVGTDTDVGKTLTVCLLGALLQERGMPFSVFKPVQTGLVREKCPDLEAYKRFFRLPDREEDVIPYRFKAAQAPAIAAEMEGRSVDIEKLMQSFYILQKRQKAMLVEGVGGVMVPLAPGFLLIDFIKRTKLPVLLVALARLGTINHTLLTVEALKKRRIPLAGILLNRTDEVSRTLLIKMEREMVREGEIDILGRTNTLDFRDLSIPEGVRRVKRRWNCPQLLRYFE
ncbi:MAG: dethiobiotin synthase [Elusimicrobia bacterium RIFOXYB2_FULL_49_7]|nr:MAG: dethiobiotin synthase [Elusimicrobia bacterium RIFOXYB2_FULL_49_7]